MITSSNPTIEYGLAPRGHRRRYVRRGLLVLVCVAVGFLAYRWTPLLRRQMGYLRVQAQAMSYNDDPGRVVYDDDAASAPGRIAADPAYVPLATNSFANNTRPIPVAAFFLPPSLGPLLNQLRPNSRRATQVIPAGVLFLHGRSSYDGERLVAVRVQSYLYSYHPQARHSRHITLSAVAFMPASALPGATLETSDSGYLSLKLTDTDALQLFAGQVDPADPSRFTIGYQLNGVPGVIDGELRPNTAPQVWLSIRSGPLEGGFH